MKQISSSRLQNSKRNLAAGMFRQVFIIASTFIIRTVILYVLGVQYQGLSGLFTSILQVLNLTELGFSTAVTFALYKPVAEEDTDSICAIMAFLKRAYCVIGWVILMIGLCLMPILKHLIKDEYPPEVNIYLLYGIYLLNAVISYWLFAYKSTLLTAMQRIDLVSDAYTIANVFGRVLQIIVIILFRSIYVYVIMILVTSIVNNILVECFSKKLCPQIKAQGIIEPELKENLIRQVKAVFLNKIGDVARNSFDNIVISAFIGLTAVAVYGNYYYIFAAVYGVMAIIVQSLRASIGNSLVTESVEKNYRDLQRFSFGFMWIVGWCTVCMLILYQPFMLIWMKGDRALLLSFRDMLLFCVYFYAISMAYTKNAYLEAKGLFHESRYLYILEAVGNLVLNIVLGKLFGVTGILVATIVTIVIFNFVGGTFVLFKHYFKSGLMGFAVRHALFIVVTIIAGTVTYWIAGRIMFQGFPGLVLKALVCILLPNMLYLLCYHRLPEYRDTLKILKVMRG